MKKMDIKETFDNEAKEYDFTSRAVNIYFDEALEQLVKNIKTNDKNIAILDVCCGTGILTEKVAKSFPNANFTGVDFSTGMVDVAKARMKNYDCKFFISDLLDDKKMAKLSGDFDLIVSSFGIHNIHGMSEKQRALKNVMQHLKTGGQYITCDILKGINKKEIEHFYNFQKQWLLKTYSAEATQNWLDLLAEEDDPVALKDNFDLLENAGLKDLKLYWKKEFLAIWSGTKK